MSSPAPRRLPPRPTFRPGLGVFRRDDRHVQVGVDPPHLVVLPADRGVPDLLRDLQRGQGLGSLTPEAGDALARLVDAGLLVGRDDVVAAAGDRTGCATAVLAGHGPDGPARLAARATCRVALHAPEPWHALATERLVSARIPLARPPETPAASLVVSAGEPRRSLVDELVRSDRTHLLLTLSADHARIGPFVVPGVTACLRCLDAHLGEVDPRRALVIEQLEDHTTVMPCDPVLSHAAVSLAVRELVAYAEGDRPATWSATLTLDADLGRPMRTWTRHPHCGCGWA